METEYPWAKNFDISPAQIKEWTPQVPTGTTLLQWCLQTGRIPEDGYVRWAAEFYSLPFVGREFFEQLPLGLDRLRSLIDANHFWSEQFFPIHEWDGVIFVGCSHPMEKLPFDNLKLLLAPPGQLTDLWKKIHDAHKAVIPELPDFMKKSEPKSDAATAAVSDSVSDSVLGLDSVKVSNSPSAPSDDLFAGLLSQVSPEEKTEQMAEPAGDSVVPEGLTHRFVLSKTPGEEEAPQGLKLTIENKPLVPEGLVLAEPVVPETKPIKPTAPAPAVGPAPAAAPSPIKAPPQTVVAAKAPAAAVVPPPPPTKFTPAAEPAAKQQASSVASSVLSKFTPIFDKGMILLFKKGSLVPWAWTNGWSPAGTTPPEVPLNDASIFRVVAESQMPYFGYIVANPTNDKFFKDWNQGQLPPHVTMVPVMVSGELKGMLLGTAVNDPQPDSTLFHAEKLSMEISNLLMKPAA